MPPSEVDAMSYSPSEKQSSSHYNTLEKWVTFRKTGPTQRQNLNWEM